MAMRGRATLKNIILGHIVESTKVIDIKLTLLIDGSERKGGAQEPYSYCVYLLSYLPLTIFS